MLAALKHTERHHRDVKIKSGPIGLGGLCRQMRWGHLSVPGRLHNLALSNIHEKKCGRMPQQALHNQLWDTCLKKKQPYSWAKTVLTDGFWSYCSVCVVKDHVTWRVYNRLLWKNISFYFTPQLSALFCISFTCEITTCHFTSGLLAGLGCAAADSIHGSKIDVKNKVPLCIIFFPSLVKNSHRLPHWILR